jgi:hypothetical protein
MAQLAHGEHMAFSLPHCWDHRDGRLLYGCADAGVPLALPGNARRACAGQGRRHRRARLVRLRRRLARRAFAASGPGWHPRAARRTCIHAGPAWLSARSSSGSNGARRPCSRPGRRPGCDLHGNACADHAPGGASCGRSIAAARPAARAARHRRVSHVARPCAVPARGIRGPTLPCTRAAPERSFGRGTRQSPGPCSQRGRRARDAPSAR